MASASSSTVVAQLVEALATRLIAQGQMLATAESCTGGLIAAACTELAGSSTWFERGFVTYSNEAKSDMLGVDAGLIARHGAVSEPVACAMAEGALARSRAQFAVAVTGIAGPSGGSPDKPVGTVWLAWAHAGQPTRSQRCLFEGDRSEVRRQTCERALQGVLEWPPASPQPASIG